MYKLENGTTSLDIDDYYVSFETGLPAGNYKLRNTIGDGGLVTGNGVIGGRIAKVSRAFTRVEEDERDNFLSWFTKPSHETVYLRKTTTNFDGIQEIKPMLAGGEKYNVRNFNYSKNVSFTMMMANPYFESTSLSTSVITVTSSVVQTETVEISGMKVFPTFELTSTNAVTLFQVKTAEGHGFRIDYTFEPSDVIVVKTTDSNLICEVNDVRLDGYFSSDSTPFELNSSNNTLYIKADAGDLKIQYYKRNL